MTKGTITIRQKVLLDADPGVVFQAYVDPERHSKFTGSPAKGRPVVGAKFTAWDGYITGEYVELVRGKKIVHRWTTTEWPAGSPPSLVEITLRKMGKKTELAMVQSGVPADQAEGYRRGWIEWYWEPLKKYVKEIGV